MQKFGYFICASAYVLALSAQAIPEQLDIAHYSAPPGVYPPTVGADPVDSSESAVLAWINKLNYNRSWYVIPSAIVPPISGTTSAIKAPITMWIPMGLDHCLVLA
nr:hypothetical protein [uncultured bacterium]